MVGEGGDGGRAVGGGWGVICGSVVDILEEAVWLHHDPSAIAEATMALDKVPLDLRGRQQVPLDLRGCTKAPPGLRGCNKAPLGLRGCRPSMSVSPLLKILGPPNPSTRLKTNLGFKGSIRY